MAAGGNNNSNTGNNNQNRTQPKRNPVRVITASASSVRICFQRGNGIPIELKPSDLKDLAVQKALAPFCYRTNGRIHPSIYVQPPLYTSLFSLGGLDILVNKPSAILNLGEFLTTLPTVEVKMEDTVTVDGKTSVKGSDAYFRLGTTISAKPHTNHMFTGIPYADIAKRYNVAGTSSVKWTEEQYKAMVASCTLKPTLIRSVTMRM